EGDRTPDLLHAMQALSQLSYGPGKDAELYTRSVRRRAEFRSWTEAIRPSRPLGSSRFSCSPTGERQWPQPPCAARGCSPPGPPGAAAAATAGSCIRGGAHLDTASSAA